MKTQIPEGGKKLAMPNRPSTYTPMPPTPSPIVRHAHVGGWYAADQGLCHSKEATLHLFVQPRGWTRDA
jgi:hypothetical protein